VLAAELPCLRAKLVFLQNPDNLLLGKPLPLIVWSLPSGPDSSSTRIKRWGQRQRRCWFVPSTNLIKMRPSAMEAI
jgi:hypothetical protein